MDSSASVEDIKKALKKKSRQLHPDKARHNYVTSKSTPAPKKPGEKRTKGTHVSKGPSQREINAFMKEATSRYQRLSVVAGILSSEQRERYDHFLRHGFPTWKGTGYYYSRYRPGLGTVILGLFVAGGGLAHYFALTISYRRQREFMEKYIRSARKQAWGDESGVIGIPAPTPVELPADEPDQTAGMNRKDRREMERRQKKDKRTGNGKSKAETKPEKIQTPTGERRRVLAENGKVLIVDSAGNVFLEEEDEDGNVDEFPLDLDEIHKPTFFDTAVVRLPIWLWRKAFDPYLKDTQPVSSDEVPMTESEKLAESETMVPAMTSSMFSDNGFEMVDATGIESDKNTGGKKRRKGKKQ